MGRFRRIVREIKETGEPPAQVLQLKSGTTDGNCRPNGIFASVKTPGSATKREPWVRISGTDPLVGGLLELCGDGDGGFMQKNELLPFALEPEGNSGVAKARKEAEGQ